MRERVFVALGSNLDDPGERVRECLSLMEAERSLRVAARSSFYRTAPVGLIEQPDFVNAMVEIDTGLSPHALLALLMRLESALGRTRGAVRNGPRRIDLDLIAFGVRRFETDALSIPHPRLRDRAFVLVPWGEIAPEFALADGLTVAELLRAVETIDVSRIRA